jgi:hypothetical protein
LENNLFGERRFIFVFLWVASTESDWRDRGTGLRAVAGLACRRGTSAAAIE